MKRNWPLKDNTELRNSSREKRILQVMVAKISSVEAFALLKRWKDEGISLGLALVNLPLFSLSAENLRVSELTESVALLSAATFKISIPFTLQGVVIEMVEADEFPRSVFLEIGPQFDSCLKVALPNGDVILLLSSKRPN